MKQLTCTCGHTPRQPKADQNCTCQKCGKEYYYSRSLRKWMFTHRTHEVKGGMTSEERMRV